MKLFVIGASGRTGREVVQQALERGHSVTALVRAPNSHLKKHPALEIVQGSPVDPRSLISLLPGHDAVISTLGHHDFKPSTLLADSATAVIAAMKETGVKQIVVESMGALFPGLPGRIARFFLKNQALDSLAMEAVMKQSGLAWTIARPPRLTQAASRAYQAMEGRCGLSTSRAAVAAFMIDAIENGSYVGKIIGLSRK